MQNALINHAFFLQEMSGRGGSMAQAIQVMSALSQPTRFMVYRMLVNRLPTGVTAGDIAAEVGMSRNAMSPHFAILARVGLVSFTKEGRNVVYRAELRVVEELSDFLGKAVQKHRDERVDLLDW